MVEYIALHKEENKLKVTISAKSLQRIRQVAKDSHSQNVVVSVSKGSVSFEICETREIIKVKETEEGK